MEYIVPTNASVCCNNSTQPMAASCLIWNTKTHGKGIPGTISKMSIAVSQNKQVSLLLMNYGFLKHKTKVQTFLKFVKCLHPVLTFYLEKMAFFTVMLFKKIKKQLKA
jgi:hypothetical protein